MNIKPRKTDTYVVKTNRKKFLNDVRDLFGEEVVLRLRRLFSREEKKREYRGREIIREIRAGFNGDDQLFRERVFELLRRTSDYNLPDDAIGAELEAAFEKSEVPAMFRLGGKEIKEIGVLGSSNKEKVGYDDLKQFLQ